MKKKKNIEISVVLPAFKEEENIEKAVLDVHKYLKNNFSEFEILVVNDGSMDKTKEIVKKIIKDIKNIRLINHETNRGYGAALRSGFKNAKHNLVFYTDSDNQFNIEDLNLLLPHIQKYDIVAGFRLNRKDPLMRIFVAWIYNLLIRLFFGLRVKDIDCSFKLYKRKIFDKIKLYSDTGFIDAEVLIKAQKAGFTIAQVGVKHYPRVRGHTTYVFGKQNMFFAFVKPKVVVDILSEIRKLWKDLH